jgi:anion-transporting  ArsA/GET3 family ATPase
MAVGTAAEPPALLSRRLVLITGKGGTGKTTLAAALARAAVDQGLRVLVAELGRDAQLPRLLVPRPPPVGYPEREIAPDLFAIRIDPYEALAEYLGIELGLAGVVHRIVTHRSFRQLMEASPGWRDLIALGKVWHLERAQDASGQRRFDLLVVDAPATGHGVTFLDVPRVVISAVRAGPLRHHTEQVEALLLDPKRTLVLPVSLAEELPVRETLALVARIRQLGLPVDRVVVNGRRSRPVPEAVGDLAAQLEGLPQGLTLGALPSPAVLASCVRTLEARFEQSERYSHELAQQTGLPILSLPYLTDGIRTSEDIATLADVLRDATGEQP